MKSIAAFLAAALLAGAATPPRNPDAAQIKAAHDLLAAMQAEKMMRMTAGMSKYASPAAQAGDGQGHQPAAEFVYTRLATPVASCSAPRRRWR
jgi:hypothetical protein